MLKASHAPRKVSAEAKTKEVVTQPRAMKLPKAEELVETKASEIYTFPSNHRRRLRTNNHLEQIIREIRRRTRVVGVFPVAHSALMLVATRLRFLISTRWGRRR